MRHHEAVGVRVRILGPVSVETATAVPSALGPKPQHILAMLVAHRGTVVPSDRLCEALWGDDQPASALATLQSHLSRLRRLLVPDGEIVGVDRGYRLDLAGGSMDLDEFDRLTRRARDASDPLAAAGDFALALACWRGPAFGDLAECEWLQAEAARLDELRLACTEEWIDCRLAAGSDFALVGDLDALVASHPLRERFVRQQMVALFREGRQGEALRRASDLRALLRDTMGLDPSPALRTLESQMLDNDPALLAPAQNRARRSAQAPLADDPTRLVGRDDDVVRICDAVRNARLVTLVGPGGVGKTRLARRVAASSGTFGDGVWFVELAHVSDPDKLADVAATALDVQPRQQLTIEATLIDALVQREQLVVLDNCEHLLDSLVPLIDRLRSHCPRLHVLATSREPLGLPSELVVSVSPLAVAPADAADVDEIAAAHAVELLVDRVVASVPDFTLNATNAPILNEICRRLDGLPLALELVAARFRSLPPQIVLERLAAPAGVLGTAMRLADPRHRTLRDTIAWSFAHLSRTEQVLFARLSAFTGSFDLDAVEAVCAGSSVSGGDGEADDTVDRLAALVDKSMVQRVGHDHSRYQLLETLREYASEQLERLGCATAVDAAHLRWYTELAERASIGLTGPDEAEWSRRIDDDFDNFRAAVGRAVRTGDVDAALQIVAGLREYAFRRIRYELASWAAACVELPGAPAHPRFLVVLAVVSYGHFVRGDFAAAMDVGQRVIELQTEGRDSSGLAERGLGNALFYMGRTDEGIEWIDRILASARNGSQARLAHALYIRSVAETSVQHNVRGAIFAGEAQAAANASGSPTARAQAAYALGIALESAEPEESLRLLRESADLAASAGNRWMEAFAQTEVWWLEARKGDIRSALARASAVINTWHHEGDWANLQLSLRRVFGLLVQLGDHHGATVLHGALNASGAIWAHPFEPHAAKDLAVAVDELRARLGDEQFAEAVAAGSTLSEAAVVAFVNDRISALTHTRSGR